MCYVSGVTCHVLGATVHLSHTTNDNSHRTDSPPVAADLALDPSTMSRKNPKNLLFLWGNF